MRSILVIRLSSMGDVIVATPLVRQLRATYPDAQIDVAVAERFADVWRYNPRVNTVFAIPSTPASAARASMTDARYDLVVDLQCNSRSRALRASIIAGRTVRVSKHRLEKLALVYLKRRPAVVTPITERYRNALAGVPLVEDQDGPEVWLEATSHQQIGPLERYSVDSSKRSRFLAGSRIAVAPGAHHFTKRWPAEHFVELCKGLASQGATPVLLGGIGDVELCASIAQAADCGVEDRSGAASVQDTTLVLDTCALIITNDTGVMHLATARRLPVVAIFGSTVGDLGFAPYGVPHTIVEHDIACRPCSHIGRSACPRGHFLCMKAINADVVLGAAKELLQRRGGGH